VASVEVAVADPDRIVYVGFAFGGAGVGDYVTSADIFGLHWKSSGLD
jgi:hypothetical protein